MKRFCCTLLLVAVSGCADPRDDESVAIAADLAIAHVSVVDVESGRLLDDQTVSIAGNRIVHVGPSAQTRIPRATQVISARGQYLIPGLWDMHTHALAADGESLFFPALLAHGVTGVRDMFTPRPLGEIVALKQAVSRGERLGPRIVAAGPLVDGPHEWNYQGSVVVSTPAAAVRAVDSLAAAGADFIKVYQALSPEVYLAIAQESKRLGLPFAGHIPSRVRPEEAALAGQRSVEHLAGLTPCGPEGEGAGDTARASRACESVVAAFAKHRTWQVPTLALSWSRTAASTILSDSTRTDLVSRELLSSWRSIDGSATAEDRGRAVAEHRAALGHVRRLRRAGVPILAGTDTPNPSVVPGISLHDELALLVDAGLTPLEALRAATLNAAQYLGGTDSLGSLAVGRLADIVLLDANPLEDIRHTRRVAAVVRGGRYLDRRALDQLLAVAKAVAAEDRERRR